MLARDRQQLRRQQLLAARATAMRAAPTASEAALWRVLRARQLGVEVRRQVVIGGLIADFVVPCVRLVIEVDGSAHRGRCAADARRDRKLAKLGYRVLRLEAELVERALPVALERVREALGR
jgi:very-short-patch-repair endonuclease